MVSGDVRRPHRSGRPRDSQLDVVILEAALSELAAQAYARTAVDAIATKAQVGKAALYRRWASKADLLDAAVRHRLQQHRRNAHSTAGALRGELIAVSHLDNINRSDFTLRILLALADAPLSARGTTEEFEAELTEPYRHALSEVLRQAASRHEIDDSTDVGLVADICLLCSSSIQPYSASHYQWSSSDVSSTPLSCRSPCVVSHRAV
jgi:AcrR family transcriptional regulator